MTSFSQDFFGLSFPIPDATEWQDTTVNGETSKITFSHSKFYRIAVSEDKTISTFIPRSDTQNEFESIYMYLVGRYGIEDRSGDTEDGGMTDKTDMEYEVKNKNRLVLYEWYEDGRRISLGWQRDGILLIVQPQ